MKRLFKLKKIDQLLGDAHSPDKKLKKVLGPVDVILLGIGIIIGAGIFTTIGTAAAGDAMRPGAGPSLMLSFVITGIVCGFSALCYAEFASMVPISGSAYTYSYATFGELVAWIIGWDLMLEYIVGCIAVSISWSGYFTGFLKAFGISPPNWLLMDYRSAMQGYSKASKLLVSGVKIDDLPLGLQQTWTAVASAPHILGVPVIFNLPAICIVALITTLLVIGIKESSRFNNIMVMIKFATIGFFVILGAFFVHPANWAPFAPNGFAGIRSAAAIVFFAFIGFDAVSTVAEETRDPARDMPIGIIGSLLICTVIYILVSAIFTGIMPFSQLQSALSHQKAEPLALALQYVNMNWAAGIVAIGAIFAQIAVILVLLLGQSRVFFSMSRDGLLPPVFSKIHARFKTPYVTTIFTGTVVAFFAAIMNIEEMVDLTNIGTLFAFVLVCLGILILRAREPGRHRSFRVPFSPVIPLLGVASCFFLMTSLPTITWIRFVVWLIIGLFVYGLYGMKHSRLNKT
jgi:APA family basic amino acid/polyamine antiporter